MTGLSPAGETRVHFRGQAVFELRLLGALELSATDGRNVEPLVRRSKRTGLLAYLAAALPRGFHRRDKLLALFWPELDEPHARAALSQALYVLRNTLGEQAVVTRGEGEVRLSGEVVWCDAAAFETALDLGRPADALALYRGDLLDGFFVTDAPEFERWLDAERARLKERASEGAWALAEAQAVEGDAVEAERWARRAAELLPDDEAVIRRLMTFLQRLGDKAAAIRAYEAFAWRLARDHELEPSAETQDLATAIRREERRPAVARTTEPATSGNDRQNVLRHPDALPTPSDTALVTPMEKRLATRRGLPRRVWPASVLLGAVAIVGLGSWLWTKQSRARWARTVGLPEAARLVRRGQAYAAFRLLRRAERYVPDDPILRELLLESTYPVTIRTTPAGATVYTRDFFDGPNSWELLGTAPLTGRLPTATLVWKISRDGFQTREGLAFTMERNFDFSLQPAAGAPADMVPVEGGPYELFNATVDLDDFWLDKYEVTNRQFRKFVEGDGYDQRSYWTPPVVKDGVVLSWDEAQRLFRDRTGRPGPATWVLGTYPDGQDDYPVSGVSWYEAEAYCASVGKQLPTVYHWYRAASLEHVTEFAQFGNFEADGPTKIGQPLRLGSYGTYDMAGNVKEWVWNEADAGRRYILGGGWNEPSYQFQTPDAQRPWNREPTYGIRCAKYHAPLPAPQLARIVQPFRDYRRETPVGDDLFAVYESLYDYDRTPLAPSVDSLREQFEHWTVERVSFAAAYGTERVPAWLFLPKNARPPYQTVVYFPGVGPWIQLSSPRQAWEGAYWFLSLVRTGRALLFPVYKGMYERHAGSIFLPNVWRDLMIQSAKDLRRAVDYLETRPDIDAQKLAYFGLSSGAGVGPIMTAVEPRFKASILLGGGLFPWRRPPESDPFNFVPRVKVPTLMINGRHDFYFPLETSQSPMFRLVDTSPADKRHRVFESGHVPTEREEFIKEILDWLDRYLGPVSRQ